MYGDPGAWRQIAAENADRLPSVRRLRPGTELRLPPVEGAEAAQVSR